MAPRPSRSIHYAWFVLAGAFMGMISFGMSRYVYSYVLPFMEKDMGLPHERMGNIASAYFIAYTAMTFVWGIVADRFGSRKPMILGMLIISLGLFSMGFANNFYTAFIFYLLCGAGASGLSIPQAPLLSRWFGPRLRATAIGIAMAGSGLISLLLGLAAPRILASATWSWVWWAGSATIFLMAIGGWLVLVDRPEQKKLQPLGLRPVTPRPTVVSGGSHPPLERFNLARALKRWTVWNLGLIYGLWGAGYVVFITFAVAYLRQLGWEAKAAAGTFALSGALSIVGPPLWGMLGDRIPKKYVLAIVLTLQCFGLLGLMNGSHAGAYAGAAAFGLGLVAVPAMMASSMADYFEPQVLGSIFGVITVMFGVGSIVGPSLAGYLADASGTLGVSLLFALAAIAGSFVAALALKKPAQR